MTERETLTQTHKGHPGALQGMGAAGTRVPGLRVKCPGPHRETTLQPPPAKCRRSCPDPPSRGDTQASERRHSGGSPPHGSSAADTARHGPARTGPSLNYKLSPFKQ